MIDVMQNAHDGVVGERHIELMAFHNGWLKLTSRVW